MSFKTAKIIYGLSIIVFFTISCDKQEDRMSFSNNTNRVINVELLNLKDTITYSILPCRTVNPDSKERFVKLFSWESDFDDIKPDTLIDIVIYSDLKNSGLSSDSLLILGNYYYRAYSYKDLEDRNWQIKYPDDGFKKGFPVKIKRE